jgi:hypothetical protein
MTYRLMVRAFNREGYCDSPYMNMINLGYPATITNQIQLLERDNTYIKV